MNVAFTNAVALRSRRDVRGARRPCICATASKEGKEQTETAKAASPPAKPQISQRMRFREEIEAPFRKVWAGSAASAGVGAFIAGSRVLAGLVGVSGVQPLSETIPNVAVDLGVIGAAVALLRLEQRAGQKRLDRISRGSRLAALRISGPQGIRQMKDSRWERRMVIVAGKADKVVRAVNEAYERREQFAEHSLQLVPVFPELDSVQEGRLQLPEGDYLASVYDRNQWRKWLDVELQAARKALGEAVDEVYVMVVRMDGKVGARAAGPPNFEKLLADVARLPQKDQYGKP